MDNLYHWSDLHQKQGDKMRLRNMFKKFYKCAEIDIFDSNISDYSGRDTCCTSWWYCGFGFTPYPFFFILTPKQCQADLGTGVQLLTLSNTLAPPSGNGNRKKIPRLHRNHFLFYENKEDAIVYSNDKENLTKYFRSYRNPLQENKETSSVNIQMTWKNFQWMILLVSLC